MDTIIPQKQCTLCKSLLPATNQYFHLNKCNPDGLQYQCKQCRKEKRKPDKPPTFLDGKRMCSKCKEYKPATLEYFYARNDRITGLYSHCKVCQPKSSPEASKRYSRNYREKHADKLKAWNVTDKMREYNRRCYNSHKEQRRQYRRSHKEERKVLDRIRNTRKMAAGGTHTVKDIRKQYANQKGRCYYCSKKVGDKFHVDHVVPISRGGTSDISNLVITCSFCNISKKDRLPHEWGRSSRLM